MTLAGGLRLADTYSVHNSVAQLRGRVNGTELLSIVQWLGELRKSGRLEVVHKQWSAELWLKNGKVVDGAFGELRGLAALGALVVEARGAEFAFFADGAEQSAIGTMDKPHPIKVGSQAAAGRAVPRRALSFVRQCLGALGLTALKGLIPAVLMAVLIIVVSPRLQPLLPATPHAASSPVAPPLDNALNPDRSTPAVVSTPIANTAPSSDTSVNTDSALSKPPLVLSERATDTSRLEDWEYAVDGPNPQTAAGGTTRIWSTHEPYRLDATSAADFLVLDAPSLPPLQDVTVRAIMRKSGGPPGGGYGIVVRDQEHSSSHGKSQSDAFYVFQVSDKGEVSIWRRDGVRWVAILPWTASTAVLQADQPNLLRVDAVSTHLAFFVNGAQVAQTQDGVLSTGGVGVFVSGDLNQAVLQKFSVQEL